MFEAVFHSAAQSATQQSPQTIRNGVLRTPHPQKTATWEGIQDRLQPLVFKKKNTCSAIILVSLQYKTFTMNITHKTERVSSDAEEEPLDWWPIFTPKIYLKWQQSVGYSKINVTGFSFSCLRNHKVVGLKQAGRKALWQWQRKSLTGLRRSVTREGSS